jgi:hypothetical protein
MNTTSEFADTIRNLLRHPAGGVVGLVDELVTLAADQGLEIDWQLDHLRFRRPAGEWEEIADGLPGKSVLRATLARIAAVCNGSRPNSVSPYGGTAVLGTRTSTSAALTASFVNTAAEQWLRLEPVRS